MEVFGIIRMTFGGVIAFIRVEELEKRLKELGVLEKSDTSE
jgi:hypothetical protein